ncbi:MAG: hypothetical protein COW00_19380 [Bdellovibrio sp. CG12_big_fil_rev_8_21_14_0_65_39_13]|nr:MAG: hypothetical protein COW78_01450 [Bdellovibrio sp. CG22_combo_CG10-13_8_21_14_all_39_27]PIQ57723.1 MAG: hypothetical protein COW00_19380 [Bdellovibrio sp. CG12_big_fil_rev_8_21_14_0_65_39_13]PIR36547.1 MAG: hypothetical protein COV37_02585 [Bdellovibrio sp. CG11_big_fil_rev_8_21_14_0_20_39_38]
MSLKIKLPQKKKANGVGDHENIRDVEVVSNDSNKSDKILDLKNFELQSEYVEKDVTLPNLSSEEKNAPEQTTIKIIRDTGVQTVSPKELKDIIRTSKDIKKVVVEKLSVNEASRVTLQYSPKKDEIEDHQDAALLSYIPETQKMSFNDDQFLENVSLMEFEFILNAEFFNPNSAFQTNKIANDKEIKLKLVKNEDESKSNWFDEPNENGESSKRVEYEKHTLLKKKGKQHNGYYYRAKDHVELFKTGSSYLKDFKDGEKNFSFISVGLDNVREKTVFGIASFFNYHSDCRIGIVTDHFEKSFYQQFVGELEKVERQILDEDLPFYVFEGKGFEIIELSNLKNVERKIKDHDFENFVEKMIDSYDLLLWDLPDMDSLKANKELYFPVIRVLDNISLIVSANQTKFKDIQNIIDYFKRYQIRIKGMLYHREASEKEEAA